MGNVSRKSVFSKLLDSKSYTLCFLLFEFIDKQEKVGGATYTERDHVHHIQSVATSEN